MLIFADACGDVETTRSINLFVEIPLTWRRSSLASLCLGCLACALNLLVFTLDKFSSLSSSDSWTADDDVFISPVAPGRPCMMWLATKSIIFVFLSTAADILAKSSTHCLIKDEWS